MNERTLTALYDTRSAADAARDELVAAGVPSTAVTIHGTESSSGTTDAGTGSGRGFWSNLMDAPNCLGRQPAPSRARLGPGAGCTGSAWRAGS